MILEGAKGKCAQEIGNALRIADIDHAEIRKQLDRLLKDLNVIIYIHVSTLKLNILNISGKYSKQQTHHGKRSIHI